MTGYIIAGSMYLILGVILFLVFKRNRRLELDNDFLRTEVKALEEYNKKELKAIHALEDSIQKAADIRREADADKKTVKNGNLLDTVNLFNKLPN